MTTQTLFDRSLWYLRFELLLSHQPYQDLCYLQLSPDVLVEKTENLPRRQELYIEKALWRSISTILQSPSLYTHVSLAIPPGRLHC